MYLFSRLRFPQRSAGQQEARSESDGAEVAKQEQEEVHPARPRPLSCSAAAAPRSRSLSPCFLQIVADDILNRWLAGAIRATKGSPDYCQGY